MEAVLDLPPTKTPIKRLPIEKLAAVECVRLHNISWETYRQLVEDQMGKPSVRLTYDTGDLEITVVSYKHENYSFTLNAIVSTVSDWLEIDFVAVGSTTFRGEKKQKSFEGDGSFYFKNAQVIRGKSAIDLSFDPSPELIIEVDITHGSLSKFPILAAIEVEEIWRFDGEDVIFYRLENKDYKRVAESICLGGVKSQTVTELVFAAEELKRSEWLKLVHRLIENKSNV